MTISYISDISDIRKMEGYIFDIKKFALHDGPGIRTTVFFSGCPLNCLWCHNPESRMDLKGENTGPNRKVSSAYIMDELLKDSVFYEESGGGVTFSGGEPFFQYRFLKDVLKKCGELSLHTAIDTTGFVNEDIFKDVLPLGDLYLYDLKVMDADKHRDFTGVSNEIILNNLKILSGSGKKVIIRFPVIPGYNDDKKNIHETAEFISALKNVDKIDLLPYHMYGMSKYKRLNLSSEMKKIKTPDQSELNKIRNLFESYDLKVSLGG
ncbi:MAG: glycyl-radical enzyme activating protein [Acidobacteriota bacterium]